MKHNKRKKLVINTFYIIILKYSLQIMKITDNWQNIKYFNSSSLMAWVMKYGQVECFCLGITQIFQRKCLSLFYYYALFGILTVNIVYHYFYFLITLAFNLNLVEFLRIFYLSRHFLKVYTARVNCLSLF